MKVWRHFFLLLSNTVNIIAVANDTTPNTGPIIIFDHGGLMFPLNNTSFSTELPLTEESTLTMETLTTKPIIMKLDSSGRSWTSAIESCDLMKFDFCIRGDSHSCLEELPSHYNLAELPTEFTAWVRSFQLYAYSALFIKCIEIENPIDMDFVIKQPDVRSIEECVLKCAKGNFDFKHIGWMDGNCSCVYDALIHQYSTSHRIIGYQKCTGYPENSTGMVTNLYKTKQHVDLSSKYCPNGAHLGSGNIFDQLDKCNSTLSYYCKNSSEVRKGTWKDAQVTCTSLNTRVVHLEELKRLSLATAQYWIQGFNVLDLALGYDNFMDVVTALHKEDFDATKCTALRRNNSGVLEFMLENCAAKLNSLCERTTDILDETTLRDNGHGDVHLPTERHVTQEKGQDRVTEEDVATQPIKATSKTRNMADNVPTQSITDGSTLLEKQPKNIKLSDEDDSDGRIFIAIGITVGIVIIVVAVVLVRRYRRPPGGRKLMKRKSYVLPQYEQVGYPFDVENDAFQSQTRRYLPSVMSYPTDSTYQEHDKNVISKVSYPTDPTYQELDKNVISKAEGVTNIAWVNATIHKDADAVPIENSEDDAKSNVTEETDTRDGSESKLGCNENRMVSMSITEIDRDDNESEQSGSFCFRDNDQRDSGENPYPLSAISMYERDTNERQPLMAHEDTVKDTSSDSPTSHNSKLFNDNIAENEAKQNGKGPDEGASEEETKLRFQGSVSMSFQEGEFSMLLDLVDIELSKDRISTSEFRSDSPVGPVNCKSS